MSRLEFIRSIIDEVGTDCIPPAKIYKGICNIHPSAVLGSNSLAYEWDGTCWLHFPQRGDVRIGDLVWIGPNAVIDRATMPGVCTEIGDGTKIDSGVKIAHNVKIGDHCMIGSNTSISGSAVVGNRVKIWANVVITKKMVIGDGAEIGSGSVVMRNVGKNEIWVGNPAVKIGRHEDTDSVTASR